MFAAQFLLRTCTQACLASGLLLLLSLSGVLQDDQRFLPKQIIQIAQFFSTGLFAHSKLYNFLFTQPQTHDEQKIMLQVIMHKYIAQLKLQ